MRQLRCIATFNRRVGASYNIRHPKSQYAATRQSYTTTVRIDWIHVSKHQQPLPRFQTPILTPLTRLTNCHQHSHVSSTHARAHALWCAVKRDSHTNNNTYLARDGSRFRVMTLTFDLMTFNVCSASAVTWSNHAHVVSPLKLSLCHNRHPEI